jgi:hypothetical protein
MSNDVDSKLDSLISRIQKLSHGKLSAAVGPPPQATASAATPQNLREKPTAQSPAASQATASKTAAFATVNTLPSSLASPASSKPPSQTDPISAAGFQPTRDEPWRPTEPDSVEQAGINETLLEAIVYRFLLNVGEAEGRRIAEQVKLPFRMVEPLLSRLKMEQNVSYKSSTSTNDYVYILSESGRAIARNYLLDCTYYGSCPVSLTQYVESVSKQTIESQYPKKKDLMRAFHDLLINPNMLKKLGPAVASGRGMFLFGFPGNGKTSIAERVTAAFGKYVWIPRSINIDGHVLRVFDPMCHTLAMPEGSGGLLELSGIDKRWVRIERPTIIAGGELTMEMLEVQHNPVSGISESPLQLKSNCGTLVIDDFGRQKMRVDELLNRWIVPLEKRYDYLNMASGKKIQVPFDQLVVFSTNLEPKDLVDDAFLRRIPYKIEVENPPFDEFKKLFQIMCKVLDMPYREGCVEYLIDKHYTPVNRPLRMCQPRDLILQARNYCLYNDLPLELKDDYLDFACENYFSVM